MNSQSASSSAKQAKGSLKEAIGKVTGDPKIQAEGAAEKAESNVPNDASRAGAAR
jgi:uncharacterized protein YjbJ (UPF0337 family)